MDLSSIDFWAQTPAEREVGFAKLRADAPISWHRQPESQLMPESEGTGGYWAVVRYDDVLEDWTKTVGGIGETLDLAVVRDAPAASLRTVHEFVDRSLSRSRRDWGDLALPAQLREQADGVWELMCALADGEDVVERLDAARGAYIALYDEAEAIAQSSIEAARRRGAAQANLPVRARLVRTVPRRYRRRIPLQWRQRIVKVLANR